MMNEPAASLPAEPLVTVITPVYNGEQFLAECIESILAQTYRNWEYVIVDNRSMDRSLDIAEQYARRDRRIRVHKNEQFVSAAENHRVGFRQMSAVSKYCKVVHADDWIFPDCVREMVALAEAHPTVGIVSAYRLEGEWVSLGGLPYPSTVVRGREARRLTLLRYAFVFGSPSSLLVRSDCIRGDEPFFDDTEFPYHYDTETCCRLLQKWDFGFVHNVLTFTRRHGQASSGRSVKLNSYLAEGVAMLAKYAASYPDDREYEKARRQWATAYRRFLATNLFRRRGDAFWQYHRAMTRHLGWSLDPFTLWSSVISDGMNTVSARFRSGKTLKIAR